MKAQPGDRIVLAASHVGEPTRDGRVVEVRGDDGGPPFVVEWSDGHTGLIFPGPGAVLRVSSDDDEETTTTGGASAAAEPAAASTSTVAPGSQEAAGATAPHVREWSVRISLYESGDDTRAQAVLLADSPEHLRASGQSHRAYRDPSVPEIGDEVAVARALRHLADTLMATAETDIAAVTGEDAQVRPT
ncbi:MULTISPECIES: dsRBD fold-containing protein [unclassified Ornithinimicrobium]|uniref:dsRBD fold-containing protein n=1 Tax=unclassified Ornithinimicrobium TaxID=2615080 RepID=UPI003855010A